MDFDAIVVGSGFGGTVAASQLVERGKRVLVIERGAWWVSPVNLARPAKVPATGMRKWLETVRTQIGDPLIALTITLVIFRITWQSWRTVSKVEPGELIPLHDH